MIEDRENFYDKNINMIRVNDYLLKTIQHLSLLEIIKLFKEICYDMVAYYDDNNCSEIYKNKVYSEDLVYQINQLQHSISTICDLFGQAIVEKRLFEEDYIKPYINGHYYKFEYERLSKKVSELESKIEIIKDNI